MTIFTGTATALITPFENNKINYNTLKKQLDFQLENHIDALVVCGTTGESATLSEKEYKDTLSFVKNYVGGKTKIIAGCGSNCTEKTIKNCTFAVQNNFDAVLIVTPYYNKCSQDGLIKHYTTIAKAIDNIPIILYNVPSRTGLNLLANTIKKLSQIDNIVAIKEASSNIHQIIEMAQIHNIDLYCGDDQLLLPFLSLGSKGIISVASNIIPKQIKDVCKFYFNNNLEKAKYCYFKISKLLTALSLDINPTPIKAAMKAVNMDKGELRLPLTELEKEKNEYLHLIMEELKII